MIKSWQWLVTSQIIVAVIACVLAGECQQHALGQDPPKSFNFAIFSICNASINGCDFPCNQVLYCWSSCIHQVHATNVSPLPFSIHKVNIAAGDLLILLALSELQFGFGTLGCLVQSSSIATAW